MWVQESVRLAPFEFESPSAGHALMMCSGQDDTGQLKTSVGLSLCVQNILTIKVNFRRESARIARNCHVLSQTMVGGEEV